MGNGKLSSANSKNFFRIGLYISLFLNDDMPKINKNGFIVKSISILQSKLMRRKR